MKHLGLALAVAIALISAGGPALADDSQPAPAPKRTPEQQKQLEEQVLKAQVEVYLNQIARWDADAKRVVLRDPKDVGPLAPTAEVFLGKAAEPIMDGKRLKIKDSVKLEPVMKAVQEFLADGGMEEFQRFERQRRDGGDPFAGGVPPKLLKLVDDIMAALDEGDSPRRAGARGKGDGKGGEKTTRVEIKVTGPDGKEYTKTFDVPGGRFNFEFDGEKGDFRFGRGGNGGGDGGNGGRDERLARLAERAEKALSEARRRAEEFMDSEDGQRLRAEIEAFLEDEEVQKRIQEAQDRVMEFLSSPEGQELQRRFAEFLLSPEGREIRKQLERLLEGRRRGGEGGTPRAQETPRSPETPRAEPRREERRRAEPREPRRGERPGGGRLY